jgi:diadenosine tetraphosphate (Ap4A) HIT family hydrolase
MEKPKTFVAKCGHASYSFGGTRQAIRTDRIWQMVPEWKPEKCPFCTREQIVVSEIVEDGGWKILSNRFTPYPFHALIIPKECWPMDKLYALGGQEKIFAALRITERIVEEEDRQLWLGTHVGLSAGQNVATHHSHWHALHPLSPATEEICEAVPALNEPPPVPYYKTELTLFRERGVRYVVGGIRAGMCFIVPENNELLALDTDKIDGMATGIYRIITASADAFRSQQWLPPDYMLGFCFAQHKFVFGFYCPILNPWGFTEIFGIMLGTPLTKPWSDETTFEHLTNSL